MINTQVFCEPTSFSGSDVEPTTPILLSGVLGTTLRLGT